MKGATDHRSERRKGEGGLDNDLILTGGGSEKMAEGTVPGGLR